MFVMVQLGSTLITLFFFRVALTAPTGRCSKILTRTLMNSQLTFSENMIIPTKKLRFTPITNLGRLWQLSLEVLQSSRVFWNRCRLKGGESGHPKQKYKTEVESKLAEEPCLSLVWYENDCGHTATNITMNGLRSSNLPILLIHSTWNLISLTLVMKFRDLNVKDNQHFVLEQREAEKSYLSLKINKSIVPNNISGKLL